jgi:hypothetical protein
MRTTLVTVAGWSITWDHSGLTLRHRVHLDDAGVNLTGAHADYSLGAPSSRMTATRVAGGALLFGPAGAIVGALGRKDRTRIYLDVETSAGLVEITAPANEERAVRKFVQLVNHGSS